MNQGNYTIETTARSIQKLWETTTTYDIPSKKNPTKLGADYAQKK